MPQCSLGEEGAVAIADFVKKAKKLQELTGSKNIKLKPIIDESLIAGFTVSYGSAQIDMSVKGQLEMITNELEGKNVGMLAA